MIKLHDREFTCPVDVSLHFISGKWKILILSNLSQAGRSSYSEFRANLPSVSEKMLSQQLKELEADKLIEKKVLTEKPLRVEYSLTELGISFSPVCSFLSAWGVDYLKKNGIDYVKDQHLYK